MLLSPYTALGLSLCYLELTKTNRANIMLDTEQYNDSVDGTAMYGRLTFPQLRLVSFSSVSLSYRRVGQLHLRTGLPLVRFDQGWLAWAEKNYHQ